MSNPEDLPERTPQEVFNALVRVPVQFAVGRENFNEYEFSDGKVFKMKAVLTGVSRIEGVLDSYGMPVYEPRFTMVTTVEKV